MHLDSNSELQIDLRELIVEVTSFHVKAHAILNDHSFYFN